MVVGVNTVFYIAEDIAKHLDLSKANVYKVINQLKEEISSICFLTITGRVNRDYYNERIYL